MSEHSTSAMPVMQPGMGEAGIEALRQRVRGIILRRGDDGYEEARHVWNGMIDRYPRAIVRCTGAADVMAVVNYARENGLPVAVRGGGHNAAGNAVCDDGIVADLSMMRAVHVDPERKVVRVQGGAKLGDIDHETFPFGLALPMGVVSATGIAGLSLHGGMGFLTRKYGLTSDHLLSADVVTADGNMIQVSESSHPDLYWALRGGGGNFGVVTAFEFRLRPMAPTIPIVLVMYPAAESNKVMRFFREYMATAPDEIMALAIYWSAPHEEPVPEEHHGVPIIAIAGGYCGPVEEGERALQPLRELATPIVDLSGPWPWLTAQTLFDPEYPNGRRYYWKSIFLDRIDEPVVQVLNEYAASRPSTLSSIDVWALGGAMGRVDPEATAFYQRRAPYLLGIEANWEGPDMDDANVRWVRDLFRDVERFSSGGTYFNFPGFLEGGENLLKQSFGSNYQRLREVKAKYDPQNLFPFNLRIPAT